MRDGHDSKQSPADIRWYHCLTLLMVGVLLSPVSVTVAIAQDGSTSIVVQRPEPGTPPSPVLSDSEHVSVPHATASDTVDSDAGDSEITSEADMNTFDLSPSIDVDVDDGDVDGRNRSADVNLSVRPGSHPLFPEDRPAWIGVDPDYSGEVHRMHVGSIPTADASMADLALGAPLIVAVTEYVDGVVLERRDASGVLSLDENYIRKNLISDSAPYMMEITTSEGPMHQKWVTLEVTPEQRAQIVVWYEEALQRERLGPIGVGLAALLGFIGVSHLVLRRKSGAATSGAPHHASRAPARGS